MSPNALPNLAPARWVVLAALALLGGGCAVSNPAIEDESADDDAPELAPARRLLLCEQGLSDRVMQWDKGLFAICEGAEQAGFELVRDGDYPAFAALDEDGAYWALFDALDTNEDGVVDDDDTPTLIHLVGFSWGGINVTDIADRLRRDGWIAPERRGVTAMVLLDPFQPLSWHANVPANVSHAWEYRQTDTTSGDCSTTVSLGLGFNGKTPRARSEMTFCSVYDLDTFMNGVGHCDVPTVAGSAALFNLTELADYPQWSGYGQECSVQ